jgi:catecholate siderophore receptor
VLRQTNQFDSNGFGVYVQDLVQVAPHWKLLAGLRYDNLTGDYSTFSIPSTSLGPVTASSYEMKVAEISKRVGVLYQPNALHSYHFSAATSFNTSGDAYSLSANNVNTPPEQSINLELGAKLDSADKRTTTRLALFHSSKLHERNTDPLVDLVTLSGTPCRRLRGRHGGQADPAVGDLRLLHVDS